ncbi:MAG: site-2 protease family protein [Caldilineales bacterium]|nr:site-2 protease family protein [Caldilineales bacterium]MDW8317224.1 site-2 protease family protein [Anaerolineae bacterium]
MTDTVAALRAAATDVMAVEDVTEGVVSPYAGALSAARPQRQPPAGVRLRGRLLLPSEEAYERLAERFAALGYTPLLRRDPDHPGGHVVLALPGRLRQTQPRIARAAALFALTVLSCLFAGAQMVEGLTSINLNLLDGLPYAAALLSILLAHELGHYVVARRVGTPVSLPYFIPVPIPGSFGTFGAFINMAAPPRNRRHWLAIAAAGPLAGLAVAIPVLWIGLSLSRVQPLPTDQPYMLEGNSLLYAAIKYLKFGQLLPSNGVDVFIHPVAFAGWAGLLVTGLNLIPAGQLDGGHILAALAGERAAGYVFWGIVVALAGLSALYQGWLLWLGLLLVFGRFRIQPLDDVTGLNRPERLLAALMLVVFLLVFTPVPMRVVVP